MSRYRTLFPLLQQGLVCLTANKRLSRHIVMEYDRWMLDSGVTAWPSPVVQSLDSWCLQLAGTAFFRGHILSSDQALCLWEKIIRDDVHSTRHELLQIVPTAKKAIEANRLLHDYETSLASTAMAEDHRAFARWQLRWDEMLRSNGWVDPDDVTQRIAGAFSAGILTPPPAVRLIGFDDFTPVQSCLIAALRDTGCRVDCTPFENESASSLSVFAAPDRNAEVDQCARWVRHRVSANPEARIGIVAPGLESYRQLIQNRFLAELDPASALTGCVERFPYNVSLGSSLHEEGAVSAALRLLSVPPTVSLDFVSWLLRTPFVIGGNATSGTRGLVDKRLRELRIGEFPAWKLPRLLRGVGCDEQMVALVQVLNRYQSQDRSGLPAEWAERFAALLESCGWPGRRSLASRDYQVIEKFRELLGRMATLDPVSGPLQRGAATALLQRLTRETVFQPESDPSRIQVLGLLESGGLEFDSVWVLGLHAGVLPPPLRPNPFIPLPLQKRLRMRHADPDRELVYAREIVGRLFRSAPEVIVSWPLFEDGLENRPSVFLVGAKETQLPELPSVSPEAVLRRHRPEMDIVNDVRANPVVPARPSKGGTGIVRDQALCPFRAFAHHRLMANGLETPDIGFDSLTRGTLVHSLLEFFWQDVHSLDQLLALDDPALSKCLAAAAELAVAREEKTKKSDLPPRQRRLECDRLVRQGAKWLELEKKRGDFTVVEREKMHQETIGQLHFRTRIDRIDRLADGSLAIIDYKTGQPDPLQWFEDRISEPQLPIYCHGIPAAEIGAVLFAVVRPNSRECRFAGLARNADDFPGVNESRLQGLLRERGWDSLDQVIWNWKRSLSELGNAFVAGDAIVDPVDTETACRYCDLATLCRIHEADRWMQWGRHHG